MNDYLLYFSSPSSPSVLINTDTKISDIGNGGVVICFCIFSALSASNSGAIHYSSPANILISDCIFYQCYSLNLGGAFSFKNLGIQAVVKRICGFKCHSGTYGQISYLLMSTNKINYLMESSISKCSYLSSSNGDSYYYDGGDPEWTNINSSCNMGKLYIGLSLVRVIKSKINFCLISSNYLSNSISIELWGGNNLISYCNIVNNTQETTNNGIVTSELSSDSVFYSCIFLYNKKNSLFCTLTGKITLNMVYSDDYSYTLTKPSFKQTFGTTNTHDLTFFSTAYCISNNRPTISIQIPHHPQLFLCFIFVTCH